jgi:hypothetical protein
MVASMTQLLDPPASADPAEPVPSVVHGLAVAAAGLREVLDAPAWPVSSQQLIDAVDHIVVLHRQAEAAYLRLLGELDARGIAATEGARNTTTWLRERHRLSPAAAKADVAAAAATHPEHGDLTGLGRALADGTVSRAHLDVATRCLHRIPTHLRREHREQIGEFFHRHSLSFPANDCDRLARQLMATLDPDGSTRYDPRAYERRTLSAVFDSTGMLLLRGQLDPAAGAIVKAALDHYAAPNPTSDEGDRDPRSSGQRYADALTTICQLALRHDQAGTPFDPGTLQRVACDAIVDRVTVDEAGHVLHYGRSVRLATPAQRRALAVRDGGCAHPDCSAPPAWCDAHHAHWWTRGGPTDLDNLCLLCSHHHSQIHTEMWTITMIDGLPYFVPPYHIDSNRTPRRNTHHDAHREAHHLGTRIRLDTDP